MSSFIAWNGKILPEDQVLISPNNHSFRYGDGCFETMKVVNGNLLLHDLHFQRLFTSLATLRFAIPQSFTASHLTGIIHELLHANHHTASARVRLVVYRGDGGLYDLDYNQLHFIIQTFPATHGSDQFNERGLVAGFYRDATKSTDVFSSLKSNNYLPYVMGAIYARQNNLDDSIITNVHNRIADATIANIFIIKDEIIKTPALSEGCVSGVMRRYLLEAFKNEQLPVEESEITPNELLNASEVFLTNATYSIRWVRKVEGSFYTNHTSAALHKKFIEPLFRQATF